MGTSHTLLVSQISLATYGVNPNLSAFFVDISYHIVYAICQFNQAKIIISCNFIYFSILILGGFS